jgi:hypothetical protein
MRADRAAIISGERLCETSDQQQQSPLVGAVKRRSKAHTAAAAALVGVESSCAGSSSSSSSSSNESESESSNVPPKKRHYRILRPLERPLAPAATVSGSHSTLGLVHSVHSMTLPNCLSNSSITTIIM